MLLALFSFVASGQTVTTFGGSAFDSRQDRAYKLDVIDVQQRIRLVRFEPWLDYDLGFGANEVEALTFVIYAETNTPDDYVLVWDSGLVSVGSDPGYKDSGLIDVEVPAGRRMALGFVLDDGNYHYHYDTPLVPLDAGWGSIAGAIYTDEDQTFSVPNTISNATVSDVGYEIRITVETFDADGDGVEADEDCDDDDPARYPGALEYCDGIDNDCTEIPDDNLVALEAFTDLDADGYGDPAAATTYCEVEVPAGLSLVADDCDDTLASVNPEGVEVCDGIDQDCSGLPDDGLPVVTWWTDADGDGAGDPEAFVDGCDVAPAGTVDNTFDCDDADGERFPGNEEVCDGKDNDCDGLSGDEGDFDGDGTIDCADCAADDPTRFPGAPELCDGTDYDCDGIGLLPIECDPAPEEKLVVSACGCDSGTSPAPLAGLAFLLWYRRRKLAIGATAE